VPSFSKTKASLRI